MAPTLMRVPRKVSSIQSEGVGRKARDISIVEDTNVLSKTNKQTKVITIIVLKVKII